MQPDPENNDNSPESLKEAVHVHKAQKTKNGVRSPLMREGAKGSILTEVKGSRIQRRLRPPAGEMLTARATALTNAKLMIESALAATSKDFDRMELLHAIGEASRMYARDILVARRAAEDVEGEDDEDDFGMAKAIHVLKRARRLQAQAEGGRMARNLIPNHLERLQEIHEFGGDLDNDD
jgi:hypothetical protein